MQQGFAASSEERSCVPGARCASRDAAASKRKAAVRDSGDGSAATSAPMMPAAIATAKRALRIDLASRVVAHRVRASFG
ncbi:hypothetical protein N6G02_04095 [Cupriavidus gilardii]|uniref:Uncharacterized protein n=1 Tax=Cupriavidus gilardii TaxID=82541 RepID=A0ABY4VTW6_9BURK|nr:hypothetical protein [Cupriavidus gilardii]MCT9115304.1 hypothetical protein [Cupriavidus gilardii]USE80593.1 hypothetical protein NDR89_12580 [Cupriavidus gilardii]